MSQNFEPNPNPQRVQPNPRAYGAPQPETIFADRTAPPPEALFADRTYYVVRWRSRRDTVYEGLNSVAETAKAGTDVSVRCISLMEANALTRRLVKADPGVAAQTFKITGSTVTAPSFASGSVKGYKSELCVAAEAVPLVAANMQRPQSAHAQRKPSHNAAAQGGGARTARSRAIYVDTLDEEEEDEVEREASG